jgi:pSer/pThr/pTyr-binding forkhead associated (FHA) protein
MGPQSKGRREQAVLQVFIFREGRFWGTECFAQTTLTIGRSPEADLQLDDDIISRTHTEVNVTAEGLVVEDLGSSNGTFVNGEPVERCFVDSRDEVSIGSFTLKFKLLAKKKPKARFGDETRIVDRETARDMTEVVQPESVDDDMVVGEASGPKQEPVRPAYQAEKKPYSAPVQEPVREVESRRGEIAAALREELGGFESPSTERMERPEHLEEEHEQFEPDEYAVETQVEPSPFVAPEPPAPEPPSGAPDHGTRWLTPEPESGPSLELAPELQPESPRQMREVDIPAAASHSAPLPGPSAAEPFRPAAEQPEPPAEGDWADSGDEEDDEYQPDFVEPFSLLNNLIRENFAQPQVPTDPTPVVEVIGYSSEKQVLSYEQVGKGGKHKIGPKKFVLAHYKEPGSCRVLFSDDFSGGVITGGRTVAVDELKTSTNQVSRKKGRNIYAYKLMKGDYANLIHEGGGSFVRFVNPPKLPPAPRTKKLDAMSWKIFGSTFLAHVLFIVILSFFSKDVSAASDADIDRFAKVDMKDIQMDKPEEEAEIPLDQLPEPDKTEEEKKEEEKKEEEKPKEEKKKKKPKKRRKKGSGPGDQGGGAGMMAALGNLSQKKPSRNIVAAVSNLDAVRVPGGRSRYKVSGLVTKLPTSSVVVSRGKGVGVKAGIDLLRGGKGRGGMAGIGPGALRGGKTGRRGVGGVVFKAPKRKMRVRGHLSREAIAKVVRKHLREIQYCYEKNLMLNSKLAGKLIMEWTITISGSVSVVKTKSNTMQTPAVAMCVSAKIKRWKFPRPKGGIVVVSYPFIFNSIGF